MPSTRWKIGGFPTDLLHLRKDLLVVDTAGMGKSTLLRFMFLQAVRESTAIPVFIELRRLRPGQNLFDYIADLLRVSSSAGEVFTKAVEDLAGSGAFVFFLDGLDEVREDERGRIIDQLKEFKQRANKNLFVLASRDLPELASFPDFRRHAIQPLRDYEATELIRRYAAGTRAAREFSQGLIDKLGESGNIGLREYIGNPLLVSLLVRAYRYKETLPLQKHVFYRQVFDALFEGHDLRKDSGALVRNKRTGLGLHHFDLLTRAFAFVSFQRHRNEYLQDEFVRLYELAIRRTPSISGVHWDAYLHDLTLTVPLFTRDGLYVRWTHKSLQEYFAASHLAAEGAASAPAVLREMLESPRLVEYSNFLGLYRDIAPGPYRHHFLRPALQSMAAHFGKPLPAVDVGEDMRNARREVGFGLHAALFKLPPARDGQHRQEQAREAEDRASGALAAAYPDFKTGDVIKGFGRSRGRIGMVVSVSPFVRLLLESSTATDEFSERVAARRVLAPDDVVEEDASGLDDLFAALEDGEYLVDENPDNPLNAPALFHAVTLLLLVHTSLIFDRRKCEALFAAIEADVQRQRSEDTGFF